MSNEAQKKLHALMRLPRLSSDAHKVIHFLFASLKLAKSFELGFTNCSDT